MATGSPPSPATTPTSPAGLALPRPGQEGAAGKSRPCLLAPRPRSCWRLAGEEEVVGCAQSHASVNASSSHRPCQVVVGPGPGASDVEKTPPPCGVRGWSQRVAAGPGLPVEGTCWGRQIARGKMPSACVGSG